MTIYGIMQICNCNAILAEIESKVCFKVSNIFIASPVNDLNFLHLNFVLG
jgi:hypothetical protein